MDWTFHTASGRPSPIVVYRGARWPPCRQIDRRDPALSLRARRDVPENWGLTSPKRSRQIPSKIVIESLNCRAKTFAFSIHCILLIWLFRPFNHSDKFIFSRASRLWPGFHRLTTACSYSSCGWTLGIWSSVEGEPEKALLLAGGRLAWQWCASRGRCLWFQLAICEGIGLWSSKKQPGWFGIVPTFHIWLSINFRGTVPKFHQISVTPQIADRK